MDTKMGPFGGHFETHFKAIRNLGSLAPPWTALAPFWCHFGVILGSCWGSFCVILDAVLRIVFVFCRYVGFHRVITCVICVITQFCVITHVIALQRVKRYIRVI